MQTDKYLPEHDLDSTENDCSNLESSQKTPKNFSDFDLRNHILRGIEEVGFSVPSPIQEQAIPIVLKGSDLIAQAQTGTGKTAAFAIPILNKLGCNKQIEALVITPTRELAMQISEEFLKIGKFARIKTICMYGGQSIKRQCDLLKYKPKVMIATPGRLLDHLMNGRLENFMPKVVVLDESDEMLDMGFLDDIEHIFTYLPSNKQTLLFSATMPEPIKKLALKILRKPEFVKISPVEINNQNIEQKYYIINENERNEAILKLLEVENPNKSIIFTRTKKEADALANNLKEANFNALALHGDMEQRDRRSVIMDFKQNNAEILVATDVAARGLDISDVSHVFNYHIPLDPQSYVHRIGRTGRAGKRGMAITLATPLEFKEINNIKQNTKAQMQLCEMDDVKVDSQALLSKIATLEITQNALEMFESLKSTMSEEKLCQKLLSYFIESSCKRTIGLKKDQIAILEHKMNNDENEQQKSSKFYKKSFSKDKKQKDKKSSKKSYGGDITDNIWG